MRTATAGRPTCRWAGGATSASTDGDERLVPPDVDLVFRDDTAHPAEVDRAGLGLPQGAGHQEWPDLLDLPALLSGNATASSPQ